MQFKKYISRYTTFYLVLSRCVQSGVREEGSGRFISYNYIFMLFGNLNKDKNKWIILPGCCESAL